MTTVGKDGGSNAGASCGPGATASGDGAASVSAHSGNAPSRGNLPMRRKTAQCAFVFEYLYDSMVRYADGSWAGGCDGCTTYDDGEAFVNAFAEAFPGRKEDPNAALASKRLRRLMAEMHKDGWLYRWRLSNHDQYHPGQEPNWQFVYRLHADEASYIKRGKWNPEYMARRYLGDGDPWVALLCDSGRPPQGGDGTAPGEAGQSGQSDSEGIAQKVQP